MNNTIKIISAIISLILFLGSLICVVWSFFIPHFGMSIVCLALAFVFGYFVYTDYKGFFKQKAD